jgi:hypothetical protein
MTKDDYNHFVCIVAGELPSKQMARYDKNSNVEKRVVYKYSDAEQIKNTYKKVIEDSLKTNQLSKEERKELEETKNYLETANAHDVFLDLTIDYEKDPETGDAIVYDNKNGHWNSYQLGKNFSVPFILKNGTEAFQAKKGDIQWNLIHNHGGEIYKRAWEMVMEQSKPKNEQESNIYENMKNRTFYFEKFGNKETYVASNIAFWGYAFLSEKTGWVELEERDNQFEWMTQYYDRFIKDLPDDTLLTIYECRK